ncbi:hypothetical protein, partial [Microvirga sp. KLBC 81]|uniref:hypothetical protein n=1 Tax=Microvirga sp. KLBC 81 TaxID=1862707 RepID=UPI00197C5122
RRAFEGPATVDARRRAQVGEHALEPSAGERAPARRRARILAVWAARQKPSGRALVRFRTRRSP